MHRSCALERSILQIYSKWETPARAKDEEKKHTAQQPMCVYIYKPCSYPQCSFAPFSSHIISCTPRFKSPTFRTSLTRAITVVWQRQDRISKCTMPFAWNKISMIDQASQPASKLIAIHFFSAWKTVQLFWFFNFYYYYYYFFYFGYMQRFFPFHEHN